jgi:hypothetical protein
VRRLVKKYEAEFPWQTYINTYVWHPPYNPPSITRRYDTVSFDVWGGGLDRNGKYMGYRGRALGATQGDRIFKRIWNDPAYPPIHWIIWSGKMWVNPAFGGRGWGPSPWGPPDSDPGHYRHIHVTFKPSDF